MGCFLTGFFASKDVNESGADGVFFGNSKLLGYQGTLTMDSNHSQFLSPQFPPFSYLISTIQSSLNTDSPKLVVAIVTTLAFSGGATLILLLVSCKRRGGGGKGK
jgi:hypothetical protein